MWCIYLEKCLNHIPFHELQKEGPHIFVGLQVDSEPEPVTPPQLQVILDALQIYVRAILSTKYSKGTFLFYPHIFMPNYEYSNKASHAADTPAWKS